MVSSQYNIPNDYIPSHNKKPKYENFAITTPQGPGSNVKVPKVPQPKSKQSPTVTKPIVNTTIKVEPKIDWHEWNREWEDEGIC